MNLETGVIQVHIEDIIPNRFQPRLNFDEQGLKELADSIREHGIIQPLVLRKLGDKYEIIAGERRYKAAEIAGLTTIPAVIANIDDNKSAEVALVENVQRRDLTAIEEARSYQNLLDKGYLTQEQLAKRMGLSQPAIANKLRLLKLDDEVQQALLEEKISERHARTLLTLSDKEVQREWLHRIINERLTVRQLDMELKKTIKGEELDEDSSINEMEDIKENLETLETEEDSTSSTTAPEFNIATPKEETISLNEKPFNIGENKFFQFDNVEEEEKGVEIIPKDNSNFEVYGAPIEKIEEEKEEQQTEEVNDIPLNTAFDRNPSNKFFTPVTETIPTFEIEKKEELVDPMDVARQLTNEENKEAEDTSLKGAITTIRNCIQDLGNKGFYINVEEIDFEDNYQINIKINKDN